jgi:hypothetical protein
MHKRSNPFGNVFSAKFDAIWLKHGLANADHTVLSGLCEISYAENIPKEVTPFVHRISGYDISFSEDWIRLHSTQPPTALTNTGVYVAGCVPLSAKGELSTVSSGQRPEQTLARHWAGRH